MSLKSTLGHVLGLVIGILIPGADAKTVDLTTSIQQEIANLYGQAAADMAEKLKLDTTGMSGPDKVFAIAKALVATAQRDGFKGDVSLLGTVVLDVAQAAYRKTLPTIGTDIVALAHELSSNPLVLVAATLVGEEIDHLTGAATAVAPVAA